MVVLITGGAGYLGSHLAHRLLKDGYHPVVLDDFSTGNRWAVPPLCEVVHGLCGDSVRVAEILKRRQIGDVIHLAASSAVEESVLHPRKYFDNNLEQTHGLLEACRIAQVARVLFCSTSTVYGENSALALNERSPTVPINPYGASKLAAETAIEQWCRANQARSLILRVFNVAGAQLEGTEASLKTGEAPPVARHLIKIAAQVACGVRECVKIFGTDYSTPDGSCVRDYVHVDDVADAFVRGLDFLRQGGPSSIFNCGSGKALSVKEVLAHCEQNWRVSLPTVYEKRRPGDGARAVADCRLIGETLGWKPRQDFATICRSAWQWEKALKARN